MKKPKLVNKGKNNNLINIPNIFLTNYPEKPLKKVHLSILKSNDSNRFGISFDFMILKQGRRNVGFTGSI